MKSDPKVVEQISKESSMSPIKMADGPGEELTPDSVFDSEFEKEITLKAFRVFPIKSRDSFEADFGKG